MDFIVVFHLSSGQLDQSDHRPVGFTARAEVSLRIAMGREVVTAVTPTGIQVSEEMLTPNATRLVSAQPSCTATDDLDEMASPGLGQKHAKRECKWEHVSP